MRAFATMLLALGLAASPAMAGTGSGDKDKDTTPAKKADDTKSTPASNSSDKPATPAAMPAGLETELQQLRELIEAQSKQLKDQNEEIRLQQQRMQIMENQLTGGAAGENADSSMSAPSSRAVPFPTPCRFSSTAQRQAKARVPKTRIRFTLRESR